MCECAAAPIVLLHGFAQSAASWDGVAQLLAKACPVIAFEFAGHGGSDCPRDPASYALEAQAEALHAFLAGFETKPVVVGYSMGGRIALAAAVRDPRAFAAHAAALVLESVGLGPADDDERAASARRDAANAARLRADGLAAFMEDWERLPLFATQRALPSDVRERVLAWAEDTDAYILEDDYCRDFRYRERSLAPLASMDARGRVIYMGTFSKSLSPALRMNYLVLPTPLLKRWREAFASSYSPVPWLNQQVLARFMTDGSWDRHLRRVQTRNRRKYDALTAALREYMGDKVDVLECGTGLHLLVRVRDGRSQDELVAAAAAADVAVYPTKKYWANPACATEGVVLVGFSSIAEADIRPGIAALARAWFE